MKTAATKRKKLHVKKGDNVTVITGANRGKTGVIKKVLIEKERAIVDGVNIVKRHTKPDANNPQGGIIEKEAPIHISNLMVIDPSTKEPTRTGRKLENGKLVRYSKKSGKIL